MSLAATALRAATSVARGALDADRHLQRAMAGLIEVAATRYAVDPGATWRPGEPLRLLFAGYAGSRNTGADARVEEMVRQVRHLFGDDHLALSILTIDPERTRGYFRTVRQLHLPNIFPKFLFDAVHDQHGVIACEGSMFKSRFANALTTMMVGALGLATAENKLSIAYGGEAGAMDPALAALVARHCANSLLVVRNAESAAVLGALGLRTHPGTDTAWTFAPHPPERVHPVLRAAGWDGETPILAICPINPFWWPVRPDVGKAAARALTGAHARAHYASLYFHNDGPEVRAKLDAYLDGIADAVRRFQRDNAVFPVMVGMEALDRGPCEALAERLGGAPVIVSDLHDHRTIVGVLRAAGMVVSSRYHACVTSMPGSVPSAGITMDERLRNLMADRGQPELVLEVDDPELAEHLYDVLCRMRDDRAAIVEGIERCVVANLERMGQMGQLLVEHVRARHPELPIRDGLGADGDPWDHLPSLDEPLQALVARHGGGR